VATAVAAAYGPVPLVTRQALEAARDRPPSEHRSDTDQIIHEGICYWAGSNSARDKAVGILKAARNRDALDIFVNTRILSKVDEEVADILIDMIPALVEHDEQVAAQQTKVRNEP
jgi:hypothetical protein